MKTNIFRGFPRFVALLPHRDSRPGLWAYRRTLFARGFAGAYSFPPAAPLALSSRPFTGDELAALARALRESVRGAGKICSRGLLKQEGPGVFAFLGLALNLALPGDFPWPDAVCHVFPVPALCAALLDAGEPGPDVAGEETPPLLAFRAAAVANLVLRPLAAGEGAYSFAWQTGKPRWLPTRWLPK
jgi:hypothetical protein